MADFTILQGKTLSLVMQPGQDVYSYNPITAVTKTAPVVITSAGHGVPDNWLVTIVSVQGMKQINALNDPPKGSDYKRATKVDANTININSVNAAGFSTYTSGGYIQYSTPVDLAGASARMKIKDKIGGTILASTEAGDTPKNIITVAVNNTLKTITFAITATNTAALTWTKGVFDAELEIGGNVTLLDSGAVTVTKEVTTP